MDELGPVFVGQSIGFIRTGTILFASSRRFVPYHPGSWQHAAGIEGRWRIWSRRRWRNCPAPLWKAEPGIWTNLRPENEWPNIEDARA